MAQVTILIPHYKTLELTKLCLRLLRKHTDLDRVKVLVIDNGSNDESSDYLKTVEWITLVSRQPNIDEPPALSHSRALDEGLKQTTTPFVLSIHTDTFVMNPRWLNFLLDQIEHKPKVAGIGSWKLEQKVWYKQLAKTVERYAQLAWYKLLNKKDHAIEGVGENFHYLRSHCALYRTDLLKQHQLSFADQDVVAGKSIHRKLTALNYEMKFIPSAVLSRYLLHINHATMVLNPELGARRKTIDKGLRRIEDILLKLGANELLKNDALDKVVQ